METSRSRRLKDAESVQSIGLLPDGTLYLDRTIFADDAMPDFTLTDYVVPADVMRLRVLLTDAEQLRGALAFRPAPVKSETEFLDLLADRFTDGCVIVEWLHAGGIPTVHRPDNNQLGDPRVLDETTRTKLAALAADRAKPVDGK